MLISIQVADYSAEDIKPSNIMIQCGDDAFQTFEEKELAHPSPRKIEGDHIIYQTRITGRSEFFGWPILCDFGEARFGQDEYTGLVQPHPYRAPEVRLGRPWTTKIDIWSIGIMVSVLLVT